MVGWHRGEDLPDSQRALRAARRVGRRRRPPAPALRARRSGGRSDRRAPGRAGRRARRRGAGAALPGDGPAARARRASLGPRRRPPRRGLRRREGARGAAELRRGAGRALHAPRHDHRDPALLRARRGRAPRGPAPVPEGVDLGAAGLRPHADDRELPRAGGASEGQAALSGARRAGGRAHGDARSREYVLPSADRRRDRARRDPAGRAGEGHAPARRLDRERRLDRRRRRRPRRRGRARALRGRAAREGRAAPGGRHGGAPRGAKRHEGRAPHRERDRHAGAHPLRGGGGERDLPLAPGARSGSAAVARSRSTSAGGASSSPSGRTPRASSGRPRCRSASCASTAASSRTIP